MNAGAAVIEAKRLAARAGPRLLFSDVSFDLARGRVSAILGPNGAGKTTLLRILLGVRKPDQGEVVRHGVIGYVPQRSETAFAYLVKDIVIMGRARHVGALGAPRSSDRTIAADALARVGVAHLAERSFDTLSGGERQLVLVARALATEPAAILLDEPASALDLRHQAHILSIMRSLARTDSLAVLFTTHHPQHAAAIADGAILMRGGGAEIGRAEELLSEQRLTDLYGVPVRRLAIPGDARGRSTLVAEVEPAESDAA
ncbi:MAG: hypothetical protein BGP06_11710 [Rhizobiales bacterium 65-9]|nr:ABC transporter ATP-binding protein [Hyphomicrobiales bacterium]OJY33955.1 MAG: hypothetical protein BGP06_11710 [Rhizobiales bacterium 65-9]